MPFFKFYAIVIHREKRIRFTSGKCLNFARGRKTPIIYETVKLNFDIQGESEGKLKLYRTGIIMFFCLQHYIIGP